MDDAYEIKFYMRKIYVRHLIVLSRNSRIGCTFRERGELAVNLKIGASWHSI